MTGPPPDRLSDFASERNPQASLTMTEKKHQSVMHELKGAQPLDALHMDSIEINNQLTTREWVRMTDIDRQSWLCPEKQMITSDKWTTATEVKACTSWGKTLSDTNRPAHHSTGALRPCSSALYPWEPNLFSFEPDRSLGLVVQSVPTDTSEIMVSKRQGEAHIAYLFEEREWGDMRPLDN